MIFRNTYVRKKVARFLSYRKRYAAFSSNDQVKSRWLKRWILILLYYGCLIEKIDADIEYCIDVLMIEYFRTVTVFNFIPPEVTAIKRTQIDEFHDYECKVFFSYRSCADLKVLYKLLKFPDIVRFQNKSKNK